MIPNLSDNEIKSFLKITVHTGFAGYERITKFQDFFRISNGSMLSRRASCRAGTPSPGGLGAAKSLNGPAGAVQVIMQ